MKKTISVRKGRTQCDWCPFAGVFKQPLCADYIKTILGIDCAEYDLSTLKVTETRRRAKISAHNRKNN